MNDFVRYRKCPIWRDLIFILLHITNKMSFNYYAELSYITNH